MADAVLTSEQREQFLDALANGITNSLAARANGRTGTRLRALRRRDTQFGIECDMAEGEGYEEYRERLSAQARLRALSGESDRMLEVELATHLPGRYGHLRRDRVRIDAHLEHAVVLPANLDEVPLEKLRQLREAIVEAGGTEIIDGE